MIINFKLSWYIKFKPTERIYFPGSSLAHSQELSTCAYLSPRQSSLHHPNLFLKDPSYCYIPRYMLVFPAVFP
jgi:hypothetical protein